MKFTGITVLLLLVFTLYQSCSSSFNPGAPYKNITVVYGILNLTDTVHYVKIEKGYLSETGGNAYTEARVADSLYYPEGTINASLEAFSNGSMVSTLPLTRIDGATIGLNKDTGIFATNPNIIYYTKSPLNATYTYQLVINNTKTGKTTTAQTSLVDSFFVQSPSHGLGATVNFYSLNYFDVQWDSAANARLYQLVIRFHYSEINISNKSDSTVKYLTWVFPAFADSFQNPVYDDFSGSNFYTFCASEIPVNPLVERRALYCDFWIYAGGKQLYTYEQVSVANSTSLVQGIINPVYTNINNGIGLFSSTYLQMDNGLVVASTTQDSLSYSSVTRKLQFLDQNGKLYQ